ncbi:MAG: endolytic transglycosylase MltG [Bacteroidetes bacterium]|nr:endolytic transglycosylase MltG [Bacteroidota bacterium]
MPKKKKKKANKVIRIFWSVVIMLAIVAATGGYLVYREIYKPNLTITDWKRPHFILIPTGSGFEDVVKILSGQHLLINEKTFRWTAQQMKYSDDNVKAGKYQLKQGMSNKSLITMLRSGKQVPVDLVFNNIRTKDQLAQKVGEQLEAPASAILNLMNDADYTKQLGFTRDNILSFFIPDTYEFYWNTSADQFFKRMKKEYDKFWTDSIRRKAKEIGFTPVQVSVIASIVQQETRRDAEKSLIAGVYINRYKKGWKLEADPTLVYALGDFSVNRVLSVYKEIDSPYNTYMYAGLPPGPICLPTIASLHAVLNYSKHNYLYFCAREDFSGYHSFAATYDQHLLNAHRFQKALDKRGIHS